jgi:hypothetical protein
MLEHPKHLAARFTPPPTIQAGRLSLDVRSIKETRSRI